MDQAPMTQLLEEMSAMRKLLSPQSRRSTMRMPHGMQVSLNYVENFISSHFSPKWRQAQDTY